MWIESDPPRRTTVFPDLIHKLPASTVTFGRDSYIIPMIPSGTVILEISRPFGCCHLDSSIPKGSLILLIFSKPRTISLILAGFNISLSMNELFRLLVLALFISISFACSILFILFLIILDVFKMAKFLSLDLLDAIILKATLDLLFIRFTYSKIFSVVLILFYS